LNSSTFLSSSFSRSMTPIASTLRYGWVHIFALSLECCLWGFLSRWTFAGPCASSPGSLLSVLLNRVSRKGLLIDTTLETPSCSLNMKRTDFFALVFGHLIWFVVLLERAA
jgi:hypothetical protein